MSSHKGQIWLSHRRENLLALVPFRLRTIKDLQEKSYTIIVTIILIDGPLYICRFVEAPSHSIIVGNKLLEHSNKLSENSFQNLLKEADNSCGSITHKSHIFTDEYILPKYEDVCYDGCRSLNVKNAGGRSDISEMFSIDYFTRNYQATDILLEMEIDYWIDYKMVDFVCTIDNNRIGVSVSRAMGYPSAVDFTREQADNLIMKKLFGLIVARNSVIKQQSFIRSILHIWCQSSVIADLLNEAYQALDDDDYGLDVKGIVFLQLTICDDIQLYRNIVI